MKYFLTVTAAASALAFGMSAAQACDWHKDHVTASVAPVEDAVLMSTHDYAPVPPDAEADTTTVGAVTPPVCADGDKDCKPAGTE